MSSPSNNEVDVYCDDITQMTWLGPPYLSVTSGEDYTGNPTAKKSSDVWTVSFQCDRNSSDGVANVFNGWCGNASHEYCPSAKLNSQPGELSFAFGMSCVFTINGSAYPINIFFAQGSKGVSNNWWFGSLLIMNSQELVIRNSNGETVAVYELSGGTSDLVLTKV